MYTFQDELENLGLLNQDSVCNIYLYFCAFLSNINSPFNNQYILLTVETAHPRTVTESKVFWISYLLPEDRLVNVVSKHCAGRQKTGVSGRHDSRRHSAQAYKRYSCWSEVLKHHGKDQRLVKCNNLICPVAGWLKEGGLLPV